MRIPMTASGESRIRDAAVKCASREDLIARLLQGADSAHIAEIGVFRGNLSEYILDWCPKIESYYPCRSVEKTCRLEQAI
jgi:hypothetical protein